MKRLTAFFGAAALCLSLAACQGQEDGSSEITTSSGETQVQDEMAETTGSESDASESSENEEEQESSILIAYFTLGRNAQYDENIDASTSASLVMDGEELVGTTEYVARRIYDDVGGDLHLIQVTEPYPADFDAVVEQNHEEMDAGTLPELAAGDLDLSRYNTVFIGYPVWATNAPQAIFSFISQYDLSGKTIIPFCTHDGYGAGDSYGDIGEAIDGEAAVLDGLAFEAENVPQSAEMIAGWLDNLEIESTAETSDQAEETAITITIGDMVLDGVLYDTALANEISQHFPLTISMVGFGGREYYGGVDFYPENWKGGQTTFENGHITYCEAHHNMAIFYAQTDDPILSVEVSPIGMITSDLSVFEELSENVDVTFSLAESTPSSTQTSDTEELATETSEPVSSDVEEPAEEGSGTNMLVAYFSYAENAALPDGVDASATASIQTWNGETTGNTGVVAAMIAEATGADMFSIQTVETYPDSYDATIDQGQEERTADARPELAAHVENLDDYDVIFLGFPNWWSDMPMAMHSFLDEVDLSGKTIVPFVTSGGSGFSNTINTIESMEAGATVQEGLSISGSNAVNAQEQVTEWLSELGYIEE